MGTLLKYWASLLIFLTLTMSCDNLSNERYYKLTDEAKKAKSMEYTSLAGLLERGSPKSMRLLEKAVRIDPYNDRAWRELSLPYLYAGYLEEWNATISKAIEINPKAWQGWRAHDRMYYFRDYAGALYDLDATDTLTKNQVDYAQNTSVYFLRGVCYLGLKDFPKSIEYFEKYIEDEKVKVGDKFIDETAFLYLGIIALYKDDYTLAIKNLQRGIQYEEGYADYHYHLSRAYCYLGEEEKAEKHVEVAIEKFDKGNYMRGYRYEAVEQIYKSQISDLKQSIDLNLS